MSESMWPSQRLVLWALGEEGFDGRLLAALAAYADATSLSTFVGQETLAKVLYRLDTAPEKWRIKRISEAANRLEAKGLVKVKRNGHRCADGTFTNLYRLNYEEFPESPRSGESPESRESPQSGPTDSPRSGPTDSPDSGGQTTRGTTRRNNQHVRTWGGAPLTRSKTHSGKA